MNDRQQALVDLLKFYATGGIKLSRNAIQEILFTHYPRTAESDYHDAGLHQITKDIREINDSDNDILILSNPKGVWLATEQEVFDHLYKERTAILKRLVLLQKKLTKAKKHNQVSLDKDLNIYVKEILQ